MSMTKGEEVGTVIVVLLLCASVAVFAYCMGSWWGEYHALRQPCAALCQIPEAIQ